MKNKIRRCASEFDPQPFHVDDKAACLQRARASGEHYVREAFPKATILRPSVIIGPRDAFFNLLARLTRVLPVLPLFGTGATRLQPVPVGQNPLCCMLSRSHRAISRMFCAKVHCPISAVTGLRNSATSQVGPAN